MTRNERHHTLCQHGKLTITVGINVCASERRLIKHEAKKKNMSMSQFLRWKITGNHSNMCNAIISEE